MAAQPTENPICPATASMRLALNSLQWYFEDKFAAVPAALETLRNDLDALDAESAELHGLEDEAETGEWQSFLDDHPELEGSDDA
jgi:hypothetical protein